MLDTKTIGIVDVHDIKRKGTITHSFSDNIQLGTKNIEYSKYLKGHLTDRGICKISPIDDEEEALLIICNQGI